MKKIILLLMLMVLISTNVYGMGIGRPYLKDNVLEVSRCGSNEIKLELQNREEKEVYVELTTDSTGCVVPGVLDPKDYYHLPAKHADNKYVFVELLAGDNCSVGDTSRIEYSIRTAKSQFGLAFTQHFTAKVVEGNEGPCPEINKRIDSILMAKIPEMEEVVDNETGNVTLKPIEKKLPKSPSNEESKSMTIKVKKPTPIWVYVVNLSIALYIGNMIYQDKKKKEEDEEANDNEED